MKDTKEISLRKATAQDSKKLWQWRNHPQVRKNFFNDSVVSWDEHQQWFQSKLNVPHAEIFVAESENADMGVIRFETDENGSSVSVTIDPQSFGKGLGAEVIKLGTEKFLKSEKLKNPIIAEIKSENIASQRAFSHAGYQLREEINGKVIYEKCAE